MRLITSTRGGSDLVSTNIWIQSGSCMFFQGFNWCLIFLGVTVTIYRMRT